MNTYSLNTAIESTVASLNHTIRIATLRIKLCETLIACKDKWEGKKITKRLFSYIQKEYGVYTYLGDAYTNKKVRIVGIYGNHCKEKVDVDLLMDVENGYSTALPLSVQGILREIERHNQCAEEYRAKRDLLIGNKEEFIKEILELQQYVIAKTKESKFAEVYGAYEVRKDFISEIEGKIGA